MNYYNYKKLMSDKGLIVSIWSIYETRFSGPLTGIELKPFELRGKNYSTNVASGQPRMILVMFNTPLCILVRLKRANKSSGHELWAMTGVPDDEWWQASQMMSDDRRPRWWVMTGVPDDEWWQASQMMSDDRRPRWWVMTGVPDDEWWQASQMMSDDGRPRWWVMTGVPETGWGWTHDTVICGRVPLAGLYDHWYICHRGLY